jgi:peptide/nickel transport system ATP-binding protein
MTVLSAEGVTHRYQVRGALGGLRSTVEALIDFSLDVAAGEAVGLVGPSASGKSTAAKCLAHWLDPTSGRVLVQGRELRGLPAGERRRERRAVQLMSQDPMAALDPRVRVGAALEEALGLAARSRASANLASALAEVDLTPDLARRFPHQLSGGQRQRVVLARALAVRPEVLIADEPTASLDPERRRRVVDLLRRLRAQRGLALIVVSHDLDVVRELTERTVVLARGRIERRGPTDEVLPRRPTSRSV